MLLQRRKGLGILLAGALVSMLAACGRGEDSGTARQAKTPASAVSPPATAKPGSGTDPAAARAEAKHIFQTRCFTCHGPEGGGDGPGSAGLQPPPRNFQDAKWQASVTDEHIEKIILYGGAAVGKSVAMPANPDLAAKPEVVSALRALVRSLGR